MFVAESFDFFFLAIRLIVQRYVDFLNGIRSGPGLVSGVKILEAGIPLDQRHLARLFVAYLIDVVKRFFDLVFLHKFFLYGVVLQIHPVVLDAVQGNIYYIGSEKPTAPKPVQIHTTGIFHGAEKIGRSGVFKGPAAAIFLEGIIE